jgi:two-component system, chemotaxis family, sensor kinase CheA
MRYFFVSSFAQMGGTALVAWGPTLAWRVAGGVLSVLAAGWVLLANQRRTMDPKPLAAADGDASSEDSEPTRDSAVVIRDLDESARNGSSRGRSDLSTLLLRAMIHDRSGFYEFYREARCRIGELADGTLAGPSARETLLSLSRNSALWGLEDLATGAAQGLRSEGKESHAPLDLGALQLAWRELDAALARVDGQEPDDVLEVSHAEYEALTAELRAGSERGVERLESLRQEPTRGRFRKLRGYAELVTSAAGLRPLEVDIQDAELRLSRERFSAVWGGLVHLVDNAVSHGFETASERLSLGKPERGRLTLRSRLEDTKIALEVSDDGRGIDWSRVAERARASKLRSATREDLVTALLSGRLQGEARPSLGLAALSAACRELHGTISIVSSPGRGTTVRIGLPLRNNLAMFVPSLQPGADRTVEAPRATAPESPFAGSPARWGGRAV